MNQRERTNDAPSWSSSNAAPIDAKSLRVFDTETATEMNTGLAIFVDAVIAEKLKCGFELDVAVRLDALPSLTIHMIASLITALCRLRETGGDLIIVTRRADLRASIDVTGFDKVFRLFEYLEQLDEVRSSCVRPPHEAVSWNNRMFCSHMT